MLMWNQMTNYLRKVGKEVLKRFGKKNLAKETWSQSAEVQEIIEKKRQKSSAWDQEGKIMNCTRQRKKLQKQQVMQSLKANDNVYNKLDAG